MDSRFFMFGQYGIGEKTSSPYAQLFVVDLKANRFVPGGSMEASYQRTVEPGNKGQGALLNLLSEHPELKTKYKIDYLLTGRLLYILLDGDGPKEKLEFRDFQSGSQYQVTLVQSANGSAGAIKSSFHLLATIEDKSGKKQSFTVGSPEYWREGVKRYRVSQILLSPDEKSLVFIIEKEEQDQAGANIRFMVETVSVVR